MKTDTTEINKAILLDKKLTKEELDFILVRMDIEKKYATKIADKVEEVVKRYIRMCTAEILELYEKTKEGKDETNNDGL